MKRKYVKKVYWEYLPFPPNEGYSLDERLGIAYHLRKGKRKFLYAEIINNQYSIMQDEMRKYLLSHVPEIMINSFLYQDLKKEITK